LLLLASLEDGDRRSQSSRLVLVQVAQQIIFKPHFRPPGFSLAQTDQLPDHGLSHITQAGPPLFQIGVELVNLHGDDELTASG